MSYDLYFIRVDNKTHHGYIEYVDQAIHLYIQIFSEAPYNEKFEYNDVKNEFGDFISKGCLLLAIQENKTVGFMCASFGINHECNTEFINKSKQHGIDLKNDIYIAELGVDKEYRNQKIGKKIVSEFIHLYENYNMFLRTGVEGNDMVIHFYNKFDFVVTELRESVENMRSDGSIAKDERLYMVKPAKKYPGIYVKSDYDSKTEDFGYQSGSEYLYGMGDNENNHDDGYSSGAEGFYGN